MTTHGVVQPAVSVVPWSRNSACTIVPVLVDG